MQNRRGIIFLALAGLLALLAAGLVTQMVPDPVKAEEPNTTPVVVARADLSIATALQASQLETVEWPTDHLPNGAIHSIQEIAGRVIRRPLAAGEPLLQTALFDQGAAGGLPAVIEPEHRAVSVKVDNVIGVAGFIAPGARVDVLATVRRVDRSKAIPFAKVILQDVRVLAVDQKLEEARGSEPELVNVVTLEVDPLEAQHLVYSAHEGRLQLAMRSPGDDEQVKTRSISVADVLGGPKKAQRTRRGRRQQHPGAEGIEARGPELLAPPSLPSEDPQQGQDSIMRKRTSTRRRTLLAACLALGLVMAESAPAQPSRAVVHLSQAAATEDRLSAIDMELGKSVFVRTDFAVKRVSVGSTEVVEVVVLGPKEIQLVPSKKGSTNLIFWSGQGEPAAVVDVSVGNSFGEIERKLRTILGSEDIHVEALGEGIILRGSVGGPVHVERASAIARSFFAKDAEDRVVNVLEVGGNQQVMIEVIIAEMQRNVGRRLSTNWNTAIATGGKIFAFNSLLGDLTSLSEHSASLSPAGVASELDFGNRIDLVGTFINDGRFMFNSFIEFATSNGLAKVLAKPTLLARSGQSASFLAGGEIPIPIAQGGAFGSITVDFKEFGVGVEFAPTVLGADRIYLEVAPEVSEPDFTIGTASGGIVTPGFITRRASTSVELADGQSFAIAGLLQDNVREAVEKIPVLGDLPVLGALFRSSEFRRNETELVLIVTPRLVRPMTGDIQLPTDAFVPPSELEFFVHGAMEAQRSGSMDTGDQDSASLMGPQGFRLPTAIQENLR